MLIVIPMGPKSSNTSMSRDHLSVLSETMNGSADGTKSKILKLVHGRICLVPQ